MGRVPKPHTPVPMVGNRAQCIQPVGGRSSNCDCRFRNYVDATSVLLSGGLEQQIRAPRVAAFRLRDFKHGWTFQLRSSVIPPMLAPRLGLTVDRGLYGCRTTVQTGTSRSASGASAAGCKSWRHRVFLRQPSVKLPGRPEGDFGCRSAAVRLGRQST